MTSTKNSINHIIRTNKNYTNNLKIILKFFLLLFLFENKKILIKFSVSLKIV